jgi:UDP-N-acetylmuramyl pentapeptide phosphotransferase/UDP-N-acetylglucosamine-1-phosphate transferase
MMLLIVLAATLSCLLTGIATWYAKRRGNYDVPGDRHSHTEPTPRGGGIGWVLAFFIGVTFLAWIDRPGILTGPGWPAVFGGTAILAGLGAWDDHSPLSARFRFAIQLTVSIVLIASFANQGWVSSWVTGIAGVLFAVWMTNLYNFMDGSNGMAGTQGVFVSAVLAWLFLRAGDSAGMSLAFLLLACCIGFLPWNLGKARVFMGDVGSLALGFLVAALLMYGVSGGAFSLPVALMVSALFLADSSLTLLVRVIKRERWYNAHRQHLYQRIIALGWTHGRVLLLYQVINLALVLPGIVIGVNHPDWAWPTAVALGLVLGLGWYLTIKRIGVLAQAS